LGAKVQKKQGDILAEGEVLREDGFMTMEISFFNLSVLAFYENTAQTKERVAYF
jgi:hypothetical protein